MDIWPHFNTKELLVRQRIAAHFAQDYPHIIEIGGYINNVSNYLDLNKHESVLIVDPLLENKKEGSLTYFKGLASDLKTGDMWQYGNNYCLILLGILMVGTNPTNEDGEVARAYWRRNPRKRRKAMARQEASFVDLTKNAGMIIIEHTLDYSLSCIQTDKLNKMLIDDLGFKIHMEITLENYEDGGIKAARRRFMRIYKK